MSATDTQREGYGAALAVPGHPEQLTVHDSEHAARETLARQAMSVPLSAAEITATIVSLIDERTITEHTGTPLEVAAMLNGVAVDHIQQPDTDEWTQQLTAAGLTNAHVDHDHAGTYVTFTAPDGSRYCLADDLSGDTQALVLTRDYRSTYDPEEDTDDQRTQRYIYAATIRQAAERTAETLTR